MSQTTDDMLEQLGLIDTAAEDFATPVVALFDLIATAGGERVDAQRLASALERRLRGLGLSVLIDLMSRQDVAGARGIRERQAALAADVAAGRATQQHVDPELAVLRAEDWADEIEARIEAIA